MSLIRLCLKACRCSLMDALRTCCLYALLVLGVNTEEPADMQALREDFLSWKFGMFIHFNVATYNNRQWALGYEDPASFQPQQLDCEQWAQAAVSAGMRYAVLTVKHTGGWCLWPSKLTKSHGMAAFVNYQNGAGDIVAEYVAACRKYNLKVGLYYCLPRDFGKPDGKESLRGLPPEAKPDPLAFVKGQLTELLSTYGQIDLLWFDQYQFDLAEQWRDIRSHVRALQPNCIIIANNSIDLHDTDIYGYEYPWLLGRKHDGWLERNNRTVLPPVDNQTPSEVCDLLGSNWFWTTGGWHLKPARQVADMVTLCNTRRSNYLLNVAPDRSGLIPQASLKRLAEIGKLLAVQE